ncbi:MAG: hypothetical protein HYT12_03320 [Candidatus Liptonbacteria bacterium]|nr:hypothetical protein [Candidatus Liptonbacteria bacterium]
MRASAGHTTIFPRTQSSTAGCPKVLARQLWNSESDFMCPKNGLGVVSQGVGNHFLSGPPLGASQILYEQDPHCVTQPPAEVHEGVL